MTKLQARNSKAPNTSFSKLEFKIWNLFVICDLNIGFSCHITMCAPFSGGCWVSKGQPFTGKISPFVCHANIGCRKGAFRTGLKIVSLRPLFYPVFR